MDPKKPEEEPYTPGEDVEPQEAAFSRFSTNATLLTPGAGLPPQNGYQTVESSTLNTMLTPPVLIDTFDDEEMPDTRKKRKLSEMAHLDAVHQLRTQEAFYNLQQASSQDVRPRDVPFERRLVDSDEIPAFPARGDDEVDVLGSGDDGDDGHYVLTAQWQASRDSVRKKRKRKSFLFGERREDQSERLSFKSPGDARPTTETGRHPKMEMAFGAKHARLHTARPGIYDHYEDDDGDMNMALPEEGAGERLHDLYGATNMNVTKDNESDEEIAIVDDVEEVKRAVPVFKTPEPLARRTRSARNANPSTEPARGPVARRSSRLNSIPAPEYEYDVEAQEPDSLAIGKSSSSRGARDTSKSEPTTPKGSSTPKQSKRVPKTTSARKPVPKTTKPTPTRPKLDHNIVTTQDVSNFYASLQPTHYTAKAQPPRGMVPVLFSYQLRAVSWMMERESWLYLKDDVRGGILADEMGLGKTIEIMGLIISNPRENFIRPEPYEVKPSHKESEHMISEGETATEPLSFTLRVENYVYPPEGVHDSGTSLIVCPEILLPQWKEELARHAPLLNVHTYKGVPNLSPLEKALDQAGNTFFNAFDVVLCSYETLAKEFPYATKPAVKTRFQTTQQSTPLTKLRWWRVIMDEAQMFSQGASNAGKLLRHLQTVNRWAVSGTPIRKDFSDLRGLLLFLGMESVYFLPTPQTLAFIKQIAWRHQMDQVSDEIIIPPSQTTILNATLTPFEAYGASKLASKLKVSISDYHDSHVVPKPEPSSLSDENKIREAEAKTEVRDGEETKTPQNGNIYPSNAISEILSLRTGKYASCPYQVLLDRYLEKSTLVQASDRTNLSRFLSTHISNEFYTSQLAVCQALNAYGDALLLKYKRLKTLKFLTPLQQSRMVSLLNESYEAYQKALDLVTYKVGTPIHDKLVTLRTPLFVLSPPSAPFSAVWYHTLINIVEAMRYQGRLEEADALEQRADSVRGTALQSQLNSVASARFKFHSTKSETSRIARNRLNTPRGEWWRHALQWIGENVPDFCARLRKGVRQLIDTQFQVARTHVLQLNVQSVEDVIDKLELDFKRMDEKRLEAITLAKVPVPTNGATLSEFYDTLDLTDDVMGSYQQLLVRDVETDGFSGLIQTKVLNLAERLILYIEFVLVERHNELMNRWRFHLEEMTPEEQAVMHKLVRWLLMAEASFREMELMKFELDHAQAYNKTKRDFAASLESLEHSALARDELINYENEDEEANGHENTSIDITHDDDAKEGNKAQLDQNQQKMDVVSANNRIQQSDAHQLAPISAATQISTDSMLDSAKEVQKCKDDESGIFNAKELEQLRQLKHEVSTSVENCLSLKHQLEFVLESGREKIPHIQSFGSKISVVAAKLMEVLQDDEEQVKNPSLPRNKALIFSKWSEPLIQLSLYLRSQGIQFRFGKDAGGLDAPKHTKNLAHRLAAFRDDPEVRVLLLNSKSQSTGLTLTQANHVFILEDVEPAHEQQAIGRAHRIGQTRVTHIWKVCVEPGQVPSFTEEFNLL